MSTQKPPPRPLNTLNLTIVSLERFFYAMRTISEADLWDDSQEYLKNRGCDTIAISLEPILAIQAMLRNRRSADTEAADKSEADERIDRFLDSHCGNPPHYPPRPPDDWPEGPWDPPRLEE